MNLVNPPQVLVRRGIAVELQQRLLATGVPAATVPSGSAVGADCSLWRQITIVCKAGGADFTFDLWWYYANARVWVKDTNVNAIVVAANTTAAFVVSTAAAWAVYANKIAGTGGDVWAEANQ